MSKKPKYIKQREKESEITLSSIVLYFKGDVLNKFISGRSFTLVWSNGRIETNNGEIILTEKVFLTKQGFYLYLSLNNLPDSMMIYYRQEQYDELRIFIGQLLKQLKNDTTTNK